MRSTINFTLFAVLSCIAMIGAIPIEDGALAGSVTRRQDLPYVPLQQQLHGEHGCSDSTETFFSDYCQDLDPRDPICRICYGDSEQSICKSFCDSLPNEVTANFCPPKSSSTSD